MSKHDDEEYQRNVRFLAEQTLPKDVTFQPSAPVDVRPAFHPPTKPDRMGNLVITDVFGPRKGRAHEGVDLRARPADGNLDIMSVMDGTISFMKKDPSGAAGISVYVDHDDGTQTRFFHGSSIPSNLKVGDEVLAGDVIMQAGSTGNSMGPHLHFEHGEISQGRFRPMDPLKSLPEVFKDYMMDDEADSLMLETRL